MVDLRSNVFEAWGTSQVLLEDLLAFMYFFMPWTTRALWKTFSTICVSAFVTLCQDFSHWYVSKLQGWLFVDGGWPRDIMTECSLSVFCDGPYLQISRHPSVLVIGFSGRSLLGDFLHPKRWVLGVFGNLILWCLFVVHWRVEVRETYLWWQSVWRVVLAVFFILNFIL